MQDFILMVMNQFGYIGVFLLIAIENIFPPIPSEVILLFGGFMTTYTKLNVVGMIIAATLGSLIGAIVLYYIGKIFNKERLKRIISGKIGKVLRLKAKDIESFLMQINTITEEKTKEVPKDSNTARQREDTLEQYVSRYNLLHDKTTDSDLLRLAQSVVSEYLDEYGVLSNSTSRSISILHTTLSEDENKAYDMLRLRPEKLSDDPEIAKKQKEAIIKKYNFANCGEAADITSSILQKLNSEKYEVSKIYFDPLTNPSHVAILLQDLSNGENYIIDNWINPEGGIFTKDNWTKMIQTIYETDDYEVKLAPIKT